MPWVVTKYGGTSVASAARWSAIAERTRALRADGRRVWIVVSALSGVTNALERAVERAIAGDAGGELAGIAATHEALADALGLDEAERAPAGALLEELGSLLAGLAMVEEASPRVRARVLSYGERLSTALGAPGLRRMGVEVRELDARSLLVSEGGPRESPLDARVPIHRDPTAERAADGADVVLTQGFVARDPEGRTVLLGRGGSDTSASLFGARLGAERVEIWTDVHGTFTADPREVPTARLIRRLGWREARELAAMGAKVLHPRCLEPVAWARIPLVVRNTAAPEAEGTEVADDGSDAAVTAVVRRGGVTLIALSTLEMWGIPGFLARAFEAFADAGVSVDLVATSQAAISVTLDEEPDARVLGDLLGRLRALGEVRVVRPCAVVSIVGRRIRAVLHELGGAFQVFREHEVHLVSQSSEDLNLSFVVDEADAPRLVQRLHAALFASQAADARLGPTWEQLVAGRSAPGGERRWWASELDLLHALCPDGEARYVYHLPTVRAAADRLRAGLPSIGRFYYAMKANPHPDVLRAVAERGFGLECVSIGEVARVRAEVGPDVPILFTPNFCPVAEYDAARRAGAEITVDGPDVLALAPDTFRSAEVAVRVDPGQGAGHHEKVVTAGAHAKFGHPAGRLHEVVEAVEALGGAIVGLHAHVGSGILDASAWARTGEVLLGLVEQLPALRWLDLGGGLGVVERAGQAPLDLTALERSLAALAGRLDRPIALRMEPGRYLVSEAGVLLARVTQVREKGSVRFVGVATGMNSLIRPALYGAWHAIHDISRPGEPPTGYAHVVGPICESGDVLGRDRLLPDVAVGDLMLIDNAGAYGHAMSSVYNDRPPATEIVLR